MQTMAHTGDNAAVSDKKRVLFGWLILNLLFLTWLLNRVYIVWPISCSCDPSANCRAYKDILGQAYYVDAYCHHIIKGGKVYLTNTGVLNICGTFLVDKYPGLIRMDGTNGKIDRFDSLLTTTQEGLIFRTRDTAGVYTVRVKER